ncbi:MAG TPA: hypothetical protein VN683_02605, partial [Acidothermaceae bacterium]|nr:hypothetical protein [Acidothermaceae bacterium]
MTTQSDAVFDPSVPRFRWTTPGSAVVVAVVTIVLLIVGVPLSRLAKQGPVNQDILMLPFAIVGFIVARKQPRNPIGWIMLALAPIFELSADAGMYSVYVYHLGHTNLPLGRLAVALTQLWVALIVLLPLPIMVFPDGRIGSRRWRWALWVYVGVCALIVISTGVADAGAFTDRHIQVDSTGELTAYNQNAGHNFAALLFPVYAVLALAFVIRQFFVYRHATGERHQQLKWLMAGGVIGILAIASTLAFSAGAGFIGIIAVPVGIGIGILKYRLYDIDRLISRTLSYALVTGLLVGIHRTSDSHHPGVAVVVTDRRCGLDADGCRLVLPAAPACAALCRPALQPRAIRRRRNDRCVRFAIARRGRPRAGATRPARRRPPICRAESRRGLGPTGILSR